MISAFFEESIIKRAQTQGLVSIEIINLRDFAIDKYGTVDDRPYGGGAGMILRADVIWAALNKFKVQSSKFKMKTVLTSAKGKQFNQKKADEYSKLNNLIIIAGHYEGVDERVLDYVDEEVSLGDFVMTGGEITAAAVVDAVVRLLPGVLKKNDAIKEESFYSVPLDRLIESVGGDATLLQLKKGGRKVVKLLEYPHYTRPEEFKGETVPKILKCGDPKKIADWRLKQAFRQTWEKRPYLLQ